MHKHGTTDDNIHGLKKLTLVGSPNMGKSVIFNDFQRIAEKIFVRKTRLRGIRRRRR